MNLEFHYYTIYYLAKYAGFSADGCKTVAYSSQFTDNALVPYSIRTDRGNYTSMQTQNYGWWEESAVTEIFRPFHFFPGDPDCPQTARRDGRKNPHATTPNSPAIKEFLVECLKTRDLYRVGLGLHVFADTFAHQNFSGENSDWNRVDESSIIPPVGHAQVLRMPDSYSGRWTDPRLVPEHRDVKNLDRFLEAAGKIYRYLCLYNHKDFGDGEAVIGMLGDLADGDKQPQERVSDFILEHDIEKYDRYEWIADAVYFEKQSEKEDPFVGYDKFVWLRDAVFSRAFGTQGSYTARDGFYDSHFYRWNESARDHVRAAQSVLKNLLK